MKALFISPLHSDRFSLDKAKWINIERERWARKFNIPMISETPKGFPPNTIPVRAVAQENL